jgi:adenylate cyclase
VSAFVLDVIAVLLLSVYGTEVCPFMEGLGATGLATNVGVAFVVSHVIGVWMEQRIDRQPVVLRAQLLYWTTLGRYVLSGFALTAYDTLVLHFPTGSGLKLVVGTLTLGHFVGVYLALAKERAVMDELAEQGLMLSEIERPRSFVRRVAIFALGAIVTAVIVITLLVIRDLDYLRGIGPSGFDHARRSVEIELVFVGSLLVSGALVLLASFGKNLRRFLENEQRVLEQVSRGELERSVPVLSDDEFGVIAAHTNRMIEGLRERRRVREVLGKIVSPHVAKALLENSELALGGERRMLTLLFSDVRDFTTWSEGAAPEVLVRDLNRYFTEMVRIVHEEGGVVDKFIGDGLMAIFGLDESEHASAKATRAACAMIDALEAIAPELSHPLGIGIGVHRGEVVAGNIGSPDRLEFTVIGDAVNTAARIESLTRKVDATILISRAVHDDLDEEERTRWESRGAHPLKGKSEPVEVLAQIV